ncbi:MAG: LPS export ABC transporter ATP-binding protein [Treponema sp.]|nr:LPS export ABC transporter ATP-binding protein [Treponema sp.]
MIDIKKAEASESESEIKTEETLKELEEKAENKQIPEEQIKKEETEAISEKAGESETEENSENEKHSEENIETEELKEISEKTEENERREEPDSEKATNEKSETDAESKSDSEDEKKSGKIETVADESEKPEETEKHVLKAEELKKVFGKKTAVNSVYFEVHSGEIVGLLGPNGAGKTTSFYMVVGFHKPTAGRIMLDKENITSLPMYKRARLGISYLPQEASIFKKLTVEENIWSILETRSDLSRKEKRDMLENLIDEFHIGHIRKQQGFTLSGGERRRTEIARSLAIEPKFLLLDEPFAGIDPIAVADIKGIIRHLSKRNIGILITDHNVRDTLEITERAYIVNKGEILVSGSQAEIIENPDARQIYLGENFHM